MPFPKYAGRCIGKDMEKPTGMAKVEWLMIWEEKWFMIFELILGSESSDDYMRSILHVLKINSYFENWEIL